jgi:hypothetical protein
VDTLVYVQVSQAVLEEPPDLCSVTSKWCWLIHSIFLSLVGYNLCLDDQKICHNGSYGVWFNVEGYWKLVVSKDK